MGKIYNVILDKNLIGTTLLEKGDPAMGVVFGEIIFLKITSGYDFFKGYCLKNNIDFDDYTDDKIISTREIPDLEVVDESGLEIKGIACSVSGMDSDCFEISILGIETPFYRNEFPHHVILYKGSS